MSQTSFSLYNFETPEKNVMNQVTKFNYQQMEKHKQFLEQLIDPLNLCDIHQELYQFYNENGFYCSKCIVNLQGQKFKVLSDFDDNVLSRLEANYQIGDVQNLELPQRDFNNPNAAVSQLLTQYKFSDSRFQNDTANLGKTLRNRDKFVKNKEFIHHISRDAHSHRAHLDFHAANKFEKFLEGDGRKPELIDELIKGFLQGS